MNSPFFIHRYRTGNLGDAVQTLALEQLLPNVRYVSRDDGKCDGPGTYVVNGWLGENVPPVDNTDCLFAGVFVNDNEENYQWMKNSCSAEIGARDPATVMWCADRGIRAILLGCATLTFDRFGGSRSGVLAVDADWPGSKRMTHRINEKTNWDEQRRRAAEYLKRYQRAELVVTSRLHVALPCLAFGTPVIICDPIGSDRMTIRCFSLLDTIGVRYGVPQVIDVSDWAKHYREFLSRNLKKGKPIPNECEAHDAQY
jgi:hypothetical protein